MALTKSRNKRYIVLTLLIIGIVIVVYGVLCNFYQNVYNVDILTPLWIQSYMEYPNITDQKIADLCIFISASTSDQQHAMESMELIDLYYERKEVYFMMDDLSTYHPTLQYKICNLTERCIFLKWPRIMHPKKNRPIYSYKTIALFQYLYDNKFQNRCNWLLKMDTDAYVDIDRFADFLMHNFDANKSLYLGYKMSCPHHINMAVGGGYVISKQILKAIEWNFTALAPTKMPKMSDCAFAEILYNNIGVNVTNIKKNILMDNNPDVEYAMNRWKERKNNSKYIKRCTMLWHKVNSTFRAQIIEEMRSIPLDNNHCSQTISNKLEPFYVLRNHTKIK